MASSSSACQDRKDAQTGEIPFHFLDALHDTLAGFAGDASVFKSLPRRPQIIFFLISHLLIIFLRRPDSFQHSLVLVWPPPTGLGALSSCNAASKSTLF